MVRVLDALGTPFIWDVQQGGMAAKRVVNPLAVMMASVLMLDHAGHGDLAVKLQAALNDVLLVKNVRTRDLGGTAGTAEFGDAVIATLG